MRTRKVPRLSKLQHSDTKTMQPTNLWENNLKTSIPFRPLDNCRLLETKNPIVGSDLAVILLCG